MPMPIAHCAAGAAAYAAFSPRPVFAGGKAGLLVFCSCLVLAVLPDLDFLPGFLAGQPNRYHQGFTHSLTFMLGCSAAFFFPLNAWCKKHWPDFPSASLLFCLLAAGLSHPLLDYLTLDSSAPQGVPLFWPFSGKHFTSPRPLFLNVERADLPGMAFFTSLLSLHNLRGAFREVLFGLSLALLVYAVRRKDRRTWF